MPGLLGGGGGPDLPKSFSLSTPGFDIRTSGGGTTVDRLPTLGLDAVNSRFPRILSDIDARRGDLRPGFGALTRTRVNTVRDRSRAAIGSLRENLARRRVAGSSFGFDALNNAERQFAKEEADVRARSFLEELNAFNNSLTQEFSIVQTELARDLAEAQFGAQVGARFSDLINSNLQFLRKQAAEESAGVGSFLGGTFGQFSGPLLNQLGGAAATKLLAGGAGAAGGGGIAASAAAGIPAVLPLSDRRAKTDIRRVGNLDNGLSVYVYRLKSGGPALLGVVAQEVMAVNPDAVVEAADGFLHVDYDIAVG